MIFTVARALLGSLFSCLCDKELRKLCSRPWLFAGLSYIPLLLGAFYAHKPLVDYCTSSSSGWLAAIWFGIVWLVFWAVLLLACVILSGSVVAIAAGSYHTEIARYILTQESVEPPPESEGVDALLLTLRAEVQKVLVLLPLGLAALLLSLLPVIGILGVTIGLILAGYQFLDYAFDALGIRVWSRFRFARRHPIMLLLIGIPSVFFMSIPLSGILLPPVAVTAATKVLASDQLLLAELRQY